MSARLIHAVMVVAVKTCVEGMLVNVVKASPAIDVSEVSKPVNPL